MRTNDADGAILARVKEELGTLIDATNDHQTRTDSSVKDIGQTVARIAGEMDGINARTAETLKKAGEALTAAQGISEIAEKFDKLELGMRETYQQIEKRMDAQEAAGLRPNEAANQGSGFEMALREKEEEIRAVLTGGRGARCRIETPRIDLSMRALPNLGDTQLGATVQDHYRPGAINLLGPVLGFFDIIPKMPPVTGDTIKAPYWTRKGRSGFVQTLVNGEITGATTPVTTVTVDSTRGFFPGAFVRFYTAGSSTLLGRLALVSKTDTVLTFATSAVDFDIADDDECLCEAISATAEEGTKPAGYEQNQLLSVTSQTIATYTKLTRQVLADSPELASHMQMVLQERLRESMELHCLYGTGTAPLLDGFMNYSGLNTDTWSTALEPGDTMADLIGYSAGRIPSRFPKFAILSSGTDFEETGTAAESDWNKLVRAKADDGHYVNTVGGGPTIINEPGRKFVGAVQVIETQMMLLDPRSASELYPRAGMTNFEMAYDGNDFIQNLITLLYEEGWAHLIKDAAAFRGLSFDQAPSQV
jgi:hypothetical protein